MEGGGSLGRGRFQGWDRSVVLVDGDRHGNGYIRPIIYCL